MSSMVSSSSPVDLCVMPACWCVSRRLVGYDAPDVPLAGTLIRSPRGVERSGVGSPPGPPVPVRSG